MVPFQFCYLGANTDDEFRKEIRFAKKKKKDFDFSRLCSDCCFSLLRKIKHPHIVSYYGLSVDPGSSVLRLVTEFVEGGSLLDWLREDSSNYPQECYFRVCQVKKRKNSKYKKTTKGNPFGWHDSNPFGQNKRESPKSSGHQC